MIRDIRRALSLLDRSDRLRWLALVPLACVVAALEATGAAAVFLLVRWLAAPGDPAALPRVLRAVPGMPERASAGGFAAAVIGFYVVRNIALVAIESGRERVVQRTASRLAAQLVARYAQAPYPFHLQRSSSSLIHTINESVDAVVEMVLGAGVQIGSELLVAAGLLALVAAAAPAETATAVLAVIALVLVPLAATKGMYARWGRQELQRGQETVTWLQQTFDTIKQIAVLGRQRFFIDRYTRAREALDGAKMRRRLAATVVRLGVETVFICSMVFAVAASTALGRRSGPEAVSVLSLFAYAGFRLVPSANRIIANANSLRWGRPFLDTLAADARMLDGRAAAAAPAPVPPLARALECVDVSYTYEGAPGPALDRVSFTVAAGRTFGIVGRTGSGKSTVVDVILGLLTPTGGRVLVDGRDLRDAGDGWRAQVGYVPQIVTLIDDTLRRNIAFGLPDGDIDEARVAEAARQSRLDEFVAALPRGLDTTVGERGVRVSGGERQRIAIARALYNRPAVVVFDEATSALDARTEREVVDAIEHVRGGRTVIVIAHRLTTVRHCDDIVVLEQGRVVARGGYEQLLTSSEAFRALVAAAGEPG